MNIERLGEMRCQLGEGPVWDVREQTLYFVDTLGGQIHRYDPATGESKSWNTPGILGSLALRERGGAVLALGHGFHFFDFETGVATLIADPQVPGQPTQFNDGKTDRRGRFFAGTVHKGAREPIGALYRLDPELGVRQADSGIIVSNGPCWSPDDTIFYFADSMRQLIYAYDYDANSGTIANRRVFANTAALAGIPDGATVDRDGRVWSAICNSGRIACYRPDGTLETLIEVPRRLVSSVMFGGPQLDQLYFTTIDAARMPPEFGCDPKDGGGELFVITDLGVTGLPETRFAG
jgi:L-arabinonolactonase